MQVSAGCAARYSGYGLRLPGALRAEARRDPLRITARGAPKTRIAHTTWSGVEGRFRKQIAESAPRIAERGAAGPAAQNSLHGTRHLTLSASRIV
jgi:hypothetical protein